MAIPQLCVTFTTFILTSCIFQLCLFFKIKVRAMMSKNIFFKKSPRRLARSLHLLSPASLHECGRPRRGN